MSMENLSLSDIASVTRGNEDGFGNMGFFWIFALLLLAGGGFGGFGNNSRYADSALNTFASASQANEILLGQKFDDISRQITTVGNGLCSSTYDLAQKIGGVGSQVAECCCNTQRAIDGVNYNGAINTASINANTTAQTQRILDKMAEDKEAQLTARINQLELQNAMAGVVRYPMASTWSMAGNPFCSGCGCNY